MQPWLDLVLLVLLSATLFHALRLERALGALRRDRESLESLAADFGASTAQAEEGIAKLRAASEGAGRQMARQIEAAATLRQDLSFLIERGDAMADRLDRQVRGANGIPARAAPPDPGAAEPRLRSQAERDLVKALKLAR